MNPLLNFATHKTENPVSNALLLVYHAAEDSGLYLQGTHFEIYRESSEIFS